MALPAAATHGPTPDLSAYWERPKSLIRRTIPSKCPVPNKPKPANPSLFIHSPADAFGFSGTDYRLIRNTPSAFQERIIGFLGTPKFQNPLYLRHILASTRPVTL
jgi:hypothetical protein